jgi:hypothetical protein
VAVGERGPLSTRGTGATDSLALSRPPFSVAPPSAMATLASSPDRWSPGGAALRIFHWAACAFSIEKAGGLFGA